MLLRYHYAMRFISQFVALLKRLSLISQTIASTASSNVTSMLSISYAVTSNSRSSNSDFNYNNDKISIAHYGSRHRLLRRLQSRSCSPMLLLFALFFWILPYLFLANYLERSLLPFRLMCYVDPDLLSVQRSLRYDSQHCIHHFFSNREKPTHCSLNKPLNMLFAPIYTKFNQSVLVVRSAPRHNSYRDYIRATWKRDIEPDIPVVFVSGRDNYDLASESDKYGDILQLDFEDSYQNLTMKMMGIYRFFLEKTKVEEIVVINDDTIVNATGLKSVLENRVNMNKKMEYSTNEIDHKNNKNRNDDGRWRRKLNDNSQYLIGKVSRGYPRLFFPWLPWYVSSHTYPHKCYPPFVQGSSFVISRNAAAKILDRICNFPAIHLDDVMMGIATNCLNIRNLHHEGFDHHLLDNFVVFHYQFSRYSAEKMSTLYYKIKNHL